MHRRWVAAAMPSAAAPRRSMKAADHGCWKSACVGFQGLCNSVHVLSRSVSTPSPGALFSPAMYGATSGLIAQSSSGRLCLHARQAVRPFTSHLSCTTECAGERCGLSGTVQLGACLSAAFPHPQQVLTSIHTSKVRGHFGADHTELFRSAPLALKTSGAFDPFLATYPARPNAQVRGVVFQGLCNSVHVFLQLFHTLNRCSLVYTPARYGATSGLTIQSSSGRHYLHSDKQCFRPFTSLS